MNATIGVILLSASFFAPSENHQGAVFWCCFSWLDTHNYYLAASLCWRVLLRSKGKWALYILYYLHYCTWDTRVCPSCDVVLVTQKHDDRVLTTAAPTSKAVHVGDGWGEKHDRGIKEMVVLNKVPSEHSLVYHRGIDKLVDQSVVSAQCDVVLLIAEAHHVLAQARWCGVFVRLM